MKLLHIPTGALCFIATNCSIIHIFEDENYWNQIQAGYGITNGKMVNDRNQSKISDHKLFYFDDITPKLWLFVTKRKLTRVKLNHDHILFNPLEFELIE